MRIGRIFYFDRLEKEIYKDMLNNLDCMIKGAKLLKKAIDEKRGEQHEEDVSKAIEMEKVCDIETSHINEKILKIKSPTSRHELILLNHRLKKIAKSIEGASYRDAMSTGIRFPRYLNDGLSRMATATIKTLQSLERVLKEMPYFSEETIKHLAEVHKYEEEMDELVRQTTNDFVTSDEDLPVKKFYAWHRILNKLEEINDSCEDASEIISRIIASKE